ncbi:hypothetical protein FA10DRAFT_295327 [Acaromyces ingoldii]|uniref:Uncharacterized protein n=1 Tax=Acaromyces ingoldii TaxID=215250 RepID=A0A316YIS9_9BASI|nr:hypothetical protein FA10DRAFT_295327 [Acaromyces ingoldii]PWN89450.1 hypothetical protein FA10DRAFT_295327 [Acaromyces ingoldii]
MKLSSFLFIALLLHAVTLVAGAEEDGEVSLVKRARTKKRHKEQRNNHWFAKYGAFHQQNVDDGNDNSPRLQTTHEAAQAGASHRPQRNKAASFVIPESSDHLPGSSAEWQLSSEDSPHSSQDWEPEGPPPTSSSSAGSEDTSSAYYSSEEWEPHQARQYSSSTARTRASISKAATRPKAFKVEVGDSSKTAAKKSRLHGANESSAIVHTSGDEKHINRVDPSTSSDHEKAPSHTLKLLDDLRQSNPAIPRRPLSEESIDPTTDSPGLQPNQSLRSKTQEKLFCEKLERLTEDVIKAFELESHPGKSEEAQKFLLTTAIFNARQKFRRATIKKDPSQASRNFFAVKNTYPLIDKELMKKLSHRVASEKYRNKNLGYSNEVARKNYHKRFGPSKQELAEGYILTPEQEKARNIRSTAKRLRDLLWKTIRRPPLVKGKKRKRRPGPIAKSWDQSNTNELFRFVREHPKHQKILELFDEAKAKAKIPPEYWEETKTTSGPSSPGGGERR